LGPNLDEGHKGIAVARGTVASIGGMDSVRMTFHKQNRRLSYSIDPDLFTREGSQTCDLAHSVNV